jgi:hypothetical protein
MDLMIAFEGGQSERAGSAAGRQELPAGFTGH